MFSWNDFVEDLDIRESMSQLKKSESVILNNVRDYDVLRRMMVSRCVNCDYMIETARCYRIAFIGEVCSLCWALYTVLKSAHLKDPNYFVNLHNAWLAAGRNSNSGGLSGNTL